VSLLSLVFVVRTTHIVDITGKGLSDLIQKVIRIPGSQDTWEAWAGGARGDGIVKLLRYFKLRIKGFTPEEKTLAFLQTKLPWFFENQRELFDLKVKDQLEHYLDGLNAEERVVRIQKLRAAMINAAAPFLPLMKHLSLLFGTLPPIPKANIHLELCWMACP